MKLWDIAHSRTGDKGVSVASILVSRCDVKPEVEIFEV